MRIDANYLNQTQMAERVFGDPKKENLIRSWSDNFGLPREKVENKQLLDERLEAIFKQIQALKARIPKCTKEEIQDEVNQALSELGLPIGQLATKSPDLSVQAERLIEAFSPLFKQQADAMNHATAESVRAAVREQSDLGTALAEANRKLGMAEGLLQAADKQIEYLQAQLLSQGQQLQLLPETTQTVGRLESAVETLEDQLSLEHRMRTEAEAKAKAEAAEKDALKRERDRIQLEKEKSDSLAAEREQELVRQRQALQTKEAELAAERNLSLWERMFGTKKRKQPDDSGKGL